LVIKIKICLLPENLKQLIMQAQLIKNQIIAILIGFLTLSLQGQNSYKTGNQITYYDLKSDNWDKILKKKNKGHNDVNYPLDLMNCEFSKDLWAINYDFNGKLNLFKCTTKNRGFFELNYFLSCNFNVGLNLLESTFEGGTLFQYCKFKKAILINGGVFKGGVSINESKLYGPLIIMTTYSHRPVYFHQGLQFKNDTILGKVRINNVVFLGGSGITIHNSTLPDTLEIFNCKLSTGVINLKNAKPNVNSGLCYFAIDNTDVSKLDMYYQHFQLFFTDSISTKTQYRDKVNSIYTGLLENFKKRGYESSYEKLDCEYREWQQSFSKQAYLLGFVGNLWWKYGYDKERVFVWTAIFLFLFSLLNFLFYRKLMSVYVIPSLTIEDADFLNRKYLKVYKNAVFYSILIFFKLGIDFNKINFTNSKYIIILITQYITGLICSGYIVNFIFS
jgi:hypothetical protein